MAEMDWSDKLNIHSLETIETLQEKLASWEWWIVRTSVAGDNREAFVFFFPMLAGLSIVCGAKLLWAAVIVEWSNLIMKWLFQGDRPFWYVQETPYFTNATRPVLRQFDNTCESGPGTPSGHLMMNVAIFLIFVRSICQLIIWDNRFLSPTMQRFMASVLYSVYSIWIALVFLSRLYIQAHFIHQCILGVIAGIVVGEFCWRCERLNHLGLWGSVMLSLFFFASSGSVWLGLVKFGYDPMWSVSKALRHCHDPVLVRVDTQPFFIMARFTGTALGLGLGLSSQLGQQAILAPGHLLRTLLACKAGVFTGRLATILLVRHTLATILLVRHTLATILLVRHTLATILLVRHTLATILLVRHTLATILLVRHTLATILLVRHTCLHLASETGGLPTHEIAQYLTLCLGVHAAVPYTIITTLPYVLTRLLPPPSNPIRKNKIN
ncbi:Phosphatidic acid phosphatase type 2/haloperoxidase [Trinorchestia longiramus]|nr:Phosphatidic acid phosphatase type 2/haloperoxidase [Trinorchestia longiramus]